MGKLIVFEGTDGSGKATQTRLLCDELTKENIAFKKLDFPRYDNDSSVLLRMYLGGKFGDKPENVNAFAASTFFAVDRYASFKEDWEDYYNDGGLIITDRYTTSNAVHQAVKLERDARDKYLSWLFDYEYDLLGIPAPDLVLYLDMPSAIADNMIKDRGNEQDIHEKDKDYLRKCRENALAVAKEYDWHIINCAADGKPRTREDINREVLRIVKELL